MSDTGHSFRYKAVNGRGGLEAGLVVAPDADAARQAIGRRGLYPLHLRASEGKGIGRRMPLSDLAIGMSTLATLLEGGSTVGSALGVMGDVLPRSWRGKTSVIEDQVRQGKPFSAALSAASAGLPGYAIAMIRAGEEQGELASAVRQVAATVDRSVARRAALRSALAYPAVLAFAGAGSVALLLVAVVPRFATIVADLGGTLPLATRALLAVSTVTATWWPVALVGSAFTAAGIWWWHATPDGQRRLDGVLLRMPWIGTLLGRSGKARATRVLAALLRGGLPVADALRHAADAAGNAALTACWLQARRQVIGGERVSDALRLCGAASEMTVRLARAGEESGAVPAMLAQAAEIEEQRIESEVRAAVRLVEPSAVVIFGGMVAFVAAAILQAIYAARPVP